MAAKSQSKRNKVIDALIALAAKSAWKDVTLGRIAARAGLTLPALRALFADRGAIVLAYFDRIDISMLAASASLNAQDTQGAQGAQDTQDTQDAQDPARDRIFDCLMNRFEAMEPDKPALRSIVKGVRADPILAGCLGLRLVRTQRWVLEAAGVEIGSGAQSFLKIQGLAGVYAKVFRVWLNEDADGLPKTMAALERQLRAGERWLGRLRGPVGVLSGLIHLACAGCRPCHKSEPKPATPRPAQA